MDTPASEASNLAYISHLQQWEASLTAIDQALRHVISDREDEFLALGANIQKFSHDARALDDQAETLTELTAGEVILQVVETLGHELEQINAVCGFAKREADVQRLVVIMDLINSLNARMGDFRKIVRTLRVLGITTRIESARLGDKGRGFMNLAVQVDSLGQNIVDSWERIATDSKGLGEQVGTALERTRTLVREQEGVAEQALGKGQENLNTLNRLTEQSGAVSQRLAQRATEISSSVGSVVSSLQFHDIARQQVEHVNEAIEDMFEMILRTEKNGGDWKQEQMEELACWVADVCSLQVSQLNHCRARFLEAIRTLSRDLSSITENIAGLSRDLQSVLGSTEDASQNALDRIEGNIHQLIEFMHGVAEKSGQLARIMKIVGSTVSQMASFVSNIEDVGSEIELIALNASVQAAHTGEEGLALGVLAGAIQRLSVDARTLTDKVAEELRGISGNALELQKMADASMDTRDLDRQVGRLEEMINTLRSLNSQAAEMFASVSSGARNLQQEVADQVRNVTFDQPVAAEFATQIQALEALAANALTLTSHECDPEDRPQRLKELLSRYTMEAERMVHLGGEESGQGDTGDVELFGAEESEFGDNIELF